MYVCLLFFLICNIFQFVKEQPFWYNRKCILHKAKAFALFKKQDAIMGINTNINPTIVHHYNPVKLYYEASLGTMAKAPNIVCNLFFKTSCSFFPGVLRVDCDNFLSKMTAFYVRIDNPVVTLVQNFSVK